MKERSTSAELRLGTATVDITPDRPIPLAGFAHRSSVFAAVDRPLFAKVWAFEQVSETGAAVRALLVQADLIWWGSERMPHLLGELNKRWGIEPSAVILHATHTHCGPQTSGRFVPSLGPPDADYVRELEARLLGCVEEALGRTEPVVVERGRGECRIGIHRRRTEGEEVTLAPNPDGPVDPEVVVIRFRSRSGNAAGVWFHYACHPTTIGDDLVSPEFPGAAMELVQRRIGGAPASFLQGCCGDIRPALVRDDEFYRGTIEDVSAYGRMLADEVVRVLEGPMEELAPLPVASGRRTARLPFRHVPDAERLREASAAEGVQGEWGRLLTADPDRLRPDIPLELSCVHLAQGLSLLAMNAEIVVEYGAFAKSLSRGALLPLPYSNGMIGYVPTAKQAEEGGYEGRESAYYFGLPAPFDPSVEPLVKEAIACLFRA